MFDLLLTIWLANEFDSGVCDNGGGLDHGDFPLTLLIFMFDGQAAASQAAIGNGQW